MRAGLALFLLALAGCWGTVNVVVTQNTGEDAEAEAKVETDTADQNKMSETQLEVTTEGDVTLHREDSPETLHPSADGFSPSHAETDVSLGR